MVRARERSRGIAERYRKSHPEKAAAQYQRQQARRRADPDYLEKKRAGRRKSNYGVGPEDFTEMLGRQGGVCAICREVPEAQGAWRRGFHIDHCHDSGVVRGLLCWKCNTALGLFDEDSGVMLAAVEYLEKWALFTRPASAEG